MPLNQTEIALLEVDSATRDEVREVHSFLKTNATLAYSPAEVALALKQEAARVERHLHKLDDLDLVTLRFDGEQSYFRYLADLPPL